MVAPSARYTLWQDTRPNAPNVRDGVCVDPPLCRGTSQGKYGSRIIGLGCEGDTVGQIGELYEMGERELVLLVSVKCGKE